MIARICIDRMETEERMERFGYIHDELDLKILILYILRRLPAPIDRERLGELVLRDEGVSYFDYIQCLSELTDSGHSEHVEGGYVITEKGDRNAEAVESSLPYTVRTGADRAMEPVIRAMNRSAMIRTAHTPLKSGGVQVELSMGDGIGEIISLRLLASGETQAEAIEKNFRQRAEQIYSDLIEKLS